MLRSQGAAFPMCCGRPAADALEGLLQHAVRGNPDPRTARGPWLHLQQVAPNDKEVKKGSDLQHVPAQQLHARTLAPCQRPCPSWLLAAASLERNDVNAMVDISPGFLNRGDV
eukprot:250254-Chlamydomonas_euryale.AAC.6